MIRFTRDPKPRIEKIDEGNQDRRPLRRVLAFLRRNAPVLGLLIALLTLIVTTLALLAPDGLSNQYDEPDYEDGESEFPEEPTSTEGDGDEAVRKSIEDARRYEDAGLTEEASELWQAIAAVLEGTDPERAADAWLSSGRLLAADERTRPNALSDFDNAIRVCEEDCARFWYFRGLAKGMLGYHRAAAEDFGEVIERDPHVAAGYAMRGNAWAALGELARAEVDYNDAIERDEYNGQIWLDLGVALGRQGKHDDALDSFDHAVELLQADGTPSWPLVSAYRNRAVAHEALGQRERATADRAEAHDLENRLGELQ